MSEPLYLVVGSTRDNAPLRNDLVDKIHGNSVDLTHTRSFNGLATTIDMRPSSILGARHICGDATVYDFGNTEIKHVLLERLPTFHHVPGLISDVKTIYIGKIVENVSKYMKSGAALEIEWDPYSVFSASAQGQHSAEVDMKLNPFNSYCDFNIIATRECHALPQEFLDEILPVADMIRQDYELYHSLGCCKDVAELAQLCRKEGYILRSLITSNTPDIKVVFNSDMSCPSLSQIIDAEFTICSMDIPDFPPTGMRMRFRHPKSSALTNGYMHSVSTFLGATFFNYEMCSLSTLTNTPYVTEYLKSVGFKDIAVNRRATNEHNGRQNVCMVRAVKV